MESLLHCGIYVSDIQYMEKFYKNVFMMQEICKEEHDAGKFLDCLIGVPNVKIIVTKLITPRGIKMGTGDMIELVKIISPEYKEETINEKRKCITETIHIAILCTDIWETVLRISEYGGEIIVEPFQRGNGNWLSFALDPEGNYLELIQRKQELDGQCE